MNENLENNENDDLEIYLKEKENLERIIEEKKQKILCLEAHKRTLVSMMINSEVGMHLPINLYQSKDEPIKISKEELFYVLNKGYIPSPSQQEFYSSGFVYPINYKIMRKFKKNRYSKINREEVIYTSIITENNGNRYFIIKDEENNICKGNNSCFNEFFKWFDDGFYFKNIEEWFGLDKAEIKNIISEMENYNLIKNQVQNSKTELFFNKNVF